MVLAQLNAQKATRNVARVKVEAVSEAESCIEHPEDVPAVNRAAKKGKRRVKAKRRATMEVGATGTGSKKKRAKRNTVSYKRYIYKVLKQQDPTFGVSKKAMSIIESFLVRTFEKLATEAACLAYSNKKRTISEHEIQTAVKFLLPGELAKHAVFEGSLAVAKFNA